MDLHSDPHHPSQPACRMVQQQLRCRGLRDDRVLDAMTAVPRHRFVPDLTIDQAYSDRALPTADGQTISQPYIVALMTHLLDIQPGHRVLEVGTGSGYQTAILAYLGARIVTIERSPTLAQRARTILTELGYIDRIRIVLGDGSLGWPDLAPYDRILVTAGAPHLPKAYRRQLADPGRIVIPIGDRSEQQLTVIDRHADHWQQAAEGGCRFVPLVGQDAWSTPDDE